MAKVYGEPKQKSFLSVRLQNLQHSETSPKFQKETFEVIIDFSVEIVTKFKMLEVQQSPVTYFTL